jgi:hypothetical protein
MFVIGVLVAQLLSGLKNKSWYGGASDRKMIIAENAQFVLHFPSQKTPARSSATLARFLPQVRCC